MQSKKLHNYPNNAPINLKTMANESPKQPPQGVVTIPKFYYTMYTAVRTYVQCVMSQLASKMAYYYVTT